MYTLEQKERMLSLLISMRTPESGNYVFTSDENVERVWAFEQLSQGDIYDMLKVLDSEGLIGAMIFYENGEYNISGLGVNPKGVDYIPRIQHEQEIAEANARAKEAELKAASLQKKKGKRWDVVKCAITFIIGIVLKTLWDDLLYPMIALLLTKK